MDLVGHDFLTLLDFTPAEIGYLLDLAAELKAKKRAGIPHDTLRGKNVALIFEKTSTRTRCSFEVAAHDLGMGTTYLDPTGSQIGKKESIADTAQVLSGMFEGIEYRGYGQAIVEELAKYASVPVWNGLTNEYHPTQILADFLTLREHFGKLQGLKFAYMGDARYNMGNSLMIGCAKMGLHFVACAPKAYWPDPALVEKCKEFARVSGGSITLSEDTDVCPAGVPTASRRSSSRTASSAPLTSTSASRRSTFRWRSDKIGIFPVQVCTGIFLRTVGAGHARPGAYPQTPVRRNRPGAVKTAPYKAAVSVGL